MNSLTSFPSPVSVTSEYSTSTSSSDIEDLVATLIGVEWQWQTPLNSPVCLSPEPMYDERLFIVPKENIRKRRTGRFSCTHGAGTDKECRQVFTRSHDLKRHLLSHNAVKLFRCEVCNQSFSRKSALNRHSERVNCSVRVKSSEVLQYNQVS